jgi:Protein of unknown function (DUF1573)
MTCKKLFFSFLGLIFFACTNNTNPYANNFGVAPSEIAAMDTAHYTFIKWKDTLADFGIIKPGDSTHLKFKFKNIGATPLFVFNTHTTCGCTVTGFPKDPIMPGRSGFIDITFSSRSEKGEINKKIVVITNTKNGRYSNLNIHGIVEGGD